MNVASDLYIAFIPSNSSYMMYYTGLIKLFSGLDCPSGKALQSQIVPKEDLGSCYSALVYLNILYVLSKFSIGVQILGKVFALSTFCESVFSLAITPLYTLLYKATLKTLPTAIFFLSASFHTGSLILFL